MDNIIGVILFLNKEIDDFGVYSVENLMLKGNEFFNIKEEVVIVYCGGFDESIFGFMVIVEDNYLFNVGKGKIYRIGVFMYFYGV